MRSFCLIGMLAILLTSCSYENGTMYHQLVNRDVPNLPANQDGEAGEKNANGSLESVREMDEFVYSARFLPPELIAGRELGKENKDTAAWRQTVNELNELLYFNFTVRHKNERGELLKFGLEDESDYYKRLDYFSFRMQDDLKLISGKDTLSCELFHFERTHGLIPHLTFLMAFRNTHAEGAKTLCFNDLVFRNGNLNFHFDAPVFEALPKTKTSQL